MSSATIHVGNINAQTSEKEVRDFFSFCGKISQLSMNKESDADGSVQTASVTFEKDTAAKTALLLDNTELGSSVVKVTSAPSLKEIAGDRAPDVNPEASEDLAQEDKPRSRIVAEYLAHGYVLSDNAIAKALELDQQHGVTARFTQMLKQFDSNWKASERISAVDEKYKVTPHIAAGWRGFSSYFDKAASTQTGLQLRSLYEQGQKQVLDVHNEAKHLAALKQGKSEGSLHAPGSGTKSSANITPEQADMEQFQKDGETRTKCNCGGVDGKCPCEPGKCACSGCSKAS